MNKRILTSITLIGATALAACGGSDNNTTYATASSNVLAVPSPVMSTGPFATTIDPGTPTGVTSGTENVSIEFTSTTTATLTVGSTPVALNFVPASVTIPAHFAGSNAGVTYLVAPLETGNDGNAVVELSYFQSSGSGGDEYGAMVYGFETDPASLPSGSTASYSGQGFVDITVEGPTGGYDFTLMTVNMTANFGAGTVSGSFDVEDPTTSMPGYIVGTLPTANITGNGFAMTPTFSTLPAGAVVNSASADGTFYGVNAGAVGGNFSATGTAGGANMVISGGYVAD